MSIPSDKVNLRLLLVSGKQSDFQFPPDASVGDVKAAVLSNWPQEWKNEPTAENERQLRILFRGRFLDNASTMESLKLGLGVTTVMHLVIKKEDETIESEETAPALQRTEPTTAKCGCIIL